MPQDELNAEIETVDGELATNDVPLLGRPFGVYGRLVKRFGTPWQDFEPFGTALFQEILDWYSRRYGPQMNPNADLGEKPILIRGVPYFFKFPVIFGSVQVNPFDQIQDVTPSLLKALTQPENNAIEQAFGEGYQHVAAIEAMRLRGPSTSLEVREIVSQGRNDLANSVILLKSGIEFQGALFHAHQAAEKFMKGALAQLTHDTLNNGRKKFGKFGHGLQEGFKALAASDNRFLAVESGITTLHASVPDMTTVRYKEKRVAVADAVRTVEAAFSVCAFVADTVFS